MFARPAEPAPSTVATDDRVTWLRPDATGSVFLPTYEAQPGRTGPPKTAATAPMRRRDPEKNRGGTECPARWQMSRRYSLVEESEFSLRPLCTTSRRHTAGTVLAYQLAQVLRATLPACSVSVW